MKRAQIARHRLTWLVLPLIMAATIASALMVKPKDELRNEALPAFETVSR
ncbi:hypothetical protein [Parvularcula maris]|uniref:Uncharacterized protein n=1 Tax=Parvularcula maris TaxID=2965077 RepID=A0A9X2LAE7_9PROT|nr:hypothetical protein [Parvularcula maris]MCQ8186066.1 hypothetical protein [Parvularcula maris]